MFQQFLGLDQTASDLEDGLPGPHFTIQYFLRDGADITRLYVSKTYIHGGSKIRFRIHIPASFCKISPPKLSASVCICASHTSAARIT